jgi:guanosine-3',5'-bis(diphosphate) 3'-pyrophosphohydrolase
VPATGAPEHPVGGNGSGSAAAIDTSRPPVDRLRHPDAYAAIKRPELTPKERRLLGDLFAIVEEHADQAAAVIDRARVEEAFVYACEHHADQLRRSGEQFIIHPVGVAKICAGMRLDTETLCAALLHDTVEDTSASLEEVSAAFGEEIAGSTVSRSSPG